MNRLYTLFFCVVLMLVNGCGSDNGNNGADLNKEEPVVTITSRKSPTGKAGGTVVSGHILSVSGTNPDGTPYSFPNFIIKGGGLQGIYQAPNGLMQYDYPYMTLMAGKSGANCIRAYGAKFVADSGDWSGETVDNQVKDVDAAFTWARNATKAGNTMYVAVGITMTNSKSLNYSDTGADSPLLKQRALVFSFIDKVIALSNDRQLLWVIGNELVASDDHVSVYREIDTIAAYIKSRGSKLPCMTAVQTVSVPELALIASNCPNLDILGVNDYYGSFGSIKGGGYLNTLQNDMATSMKSDNGWKKPYIVSEFGSYDLAGLNMPAVKLAPPPFVPSAIYGLEANSSLLAQDYLDNYTTWIKPFAEANQGCVGSFCYVWQNPVFSDHFAYFYEMFLSGPTETPSYNPRGNYRLEASEKMIQAWGGTPTGLKYPRILTPDNDPQGITCSFKVTKDTTGNPPTVSPGASLSASVAASYDGTRQPGFTWYVVNDTADHYNPQKYQGAKDEIPAGSSNKTEKQGTTYKNTLSFKAPAVAGNYQLRVNVTCDNETNPSGQGTAATAAILFIVK
jgi:hypothetical protein